MNPSSLQYQLTDEEKATFERDGLLQVENALPPDRLGALLDATDRLYHKQIAAGHPADTAMFYTDFIPQDQVFLDLVDYDRILPKVWGLLGWNIYLYHGHLNVTPPSGTSRSEATFGWHQDSGRVNFDMETHPRPRLSLKVAYFLSDVSAEGRGNFWVVPGSHRSDELDRPTDGTGQPAGAVPVLAKPGTAVFFDRRLWHAGSPNWSDVTRKVLFYGYGYRWIRTKDDMTVQELWDQSDPIRRQLLGYGVNANGHYSPTDEDVPLRSWLHEHNIA